MRRFDVVPINSDFAENSNVIITSLCYIPIIGYIYAGTNLGDIMLYKYEDLERIDKKDNYLFTFDINRERIRSNEKCLKIRNISQKCKKIDELYPIINYDTILDDNMESKMHIGGVILCICENNLLYLDYRLKGKITILCKGVSTISIWKDSYNINAFQTKFCVATKKKIIFYNTCILGDLLNIDEIEEEEINNRKTNINKDILELNNINNKKEILSKNKNTVINSWFGFSNNQLNNQDLNKDKNKDEFNINIEFIQVEEIQIPNKIISFSDNISNIEWCDNWVCFVISNTYFIMNIDDQSINDILSLDQLDNYFHPQIIILPEQEFMLTCQDNLGVFFNFNNLQPSPKSMIQWPSEGLTGVVLSSPYLLGGTKSGLIQIYSLANNDHININDNIHDSNIFNNSDIQYNNGRKYSNKNQLSLQTLQLDDEITCISTGNTCENIFLNSSKILTAPLGPLVIVSTRTKIYALIPIPIEESIFELVNRNQGKHAINLLKTYCNTNDLLYNSLLFRTQCLAGWFEFKNLQFEKAFNCFEQAHIDPRVLLILFWKDLIPIESNDDLFNNEDIDIYDYARLPWINSKGNLSEDLTPDIKFHETLIKSLLRIKNEKKLPTNINEFIQNLLLSNLDLSNNRFPINIESNSNKIDEYNYIANRSLKLFLLKERIRYTNNLDIKQENNFNEDNKLIYSTGKIMDIAFIHLIINECNNKLSNSEDISFNNKIILSILEIESDKSNQIQLKKDNGLFNVKKSLIFSEFDIDKYEEFLINYNRYDILAILLSYKSLYLKSLEILENIINSSSKNLLELFTNENSNYINIYSIIYHILIHMCYSEKTPIHIQANILKRYSRFIIDKFDKYSIDYLFTLKSIDKYPLTIDEILNLFNYMPKNISNNLTKSYLERIIYNEENIELKHKINLMEIYINDISSNQNISEDNIYSSFEYLFTDKYQPSRLAMMLEEIEDFDTEILIKHINLDNSYRYQIHDQIIIEYIIILFRCNRHIEALKFIINILENIELAEIYTIAWTFHNRYEIKQVNLNEDYTQIEIDSNLNNINSINFRYNKVFLFTEFKLWREFVNEYSDNINNMKEDGNGDLNINSWLDILDLSQNELSLVSEEFIKPTYNKTAYKKIIDKFFNSISNNEDLNYFNYYIKYNDGLISLISILIDSWRFHNERYIYEKNNENESKIKINFEKAEKYQNATFYILNKYSSNTDLSISRVLEKIPEEWPLMKMINFLKNSLAISIHENTTNSISTNLSAISYLRLYEKWSTCRSNHITITQDMICHVCSLKLGNKQCALYPDGTCVHVHCLSNDYYSNIDK